MMSRSRKRLTAEERRAKILSAAVQAFAFDGYDNTSMDRVADLAKVTKPILYDHFPSKQALYLTMLESIRDGLIAKGKAIAEAGDDPEPEIPSRHRCVFAIRRATARCCTRAADRPAR